MKKTVRFAGQLFDYILQDPEGDIPIAVEKNKSGKFSVRAGVKRGCSYTPGNHPFPVTVTIVKGWGRFFLREEVIEYHPGSVFKISEYVPHSFIRVLDDTIFVKDVPSLTPV